MRTTIGRLDAAPADAHDVYLRLHLLSSRLVRPHGCNLDGIFGLLANVAWTNHGPCPVPGFEATRLRLRQPGPGHRVRGGQVPADGRLRAAGRGAHRRRGPGPARRAPGRRAPRSCTRASSTSTPAPSALPWWRAGSRPAWWSATAPTSAAGRPSWARCPAAARRISVGERCLIGANAGIGISLGDDCVVEAGLYVTAGTKVALPDGQVVKARELSGRPGLLWLRDSQTGAVRVTARPGPASR